VYGERLTDAIGPLPFPSFWRLGEMARLLEVEETEVRRMLRAREIPHYWIGGEYRILTADLIRWLLLQRSTGGERDGRTRRR
jgi:excisionase family DNA binding protein